MSAATDAVEDALDQYVASMGHKGVDPGGFRTRTLAKMVDLEPSKMSTYLQEYRLAQARPDATTRYVIGCQGYGRDARWRILAKPGTDPKVVRLARKDQGRWIVKDAIERAMRDRLFEVNPSLAGVESDALIDSALDFATRQFEAVGTFVEQVLAVNGKGGASA